MKLAFWGQRITKANKGDRGITKAVEHEPKWRVAKNGANRTQEERLAITQ